MPVAAMEPTRVGWVQAPPLQLTQEQTPIAHHHHGFSIQLSLTQVFLLWCLHYQGGSSSSMFFAFLPQILGEILSSSISEVYLPAVLKYCLCTLSFQYFFLMLFLGKLCCCM